MNALEDFLAETDWANVLVRLSAYACRRLLRARLSTQEAEEIAQEAVQRMFDEEYREWSTTEPSASGLLWHLQSEINGIVANRASLRARRGDARPVDEAFQVVDEGTRADACQNDEDCMYALLGRLDDDADACEVLDLVYRGFLKASEQADELGWPRARVYEARRRLKKAAKLEFHGQTP